MGLEFRILGPFEVVRDGASLELGWPKQRALLALLLLRHGEAVAAERIADELWEQRPPASAPNMLQGYVSRLRKVLPPDEGGPRLVTAGGGYALRVESGELDADRFEQLTGLAREGLAVGREADAGALLRTALELWRGPALADFAFEAFAAHESRRLEELRLAALEDRLEAELALGGHAALVPELGALVAEHPLRERLRCQQILALYRAGRQAEALEAFQHARRTLDDELGLEPGPELRALERAVLTQDPSLEVQQPVEVRVSPVPAPPTRLVGREQELAGLVPLLARADVRLVTLTGPGGVGKTRLALAAAASIAAEGGTAAFVDLSTLEDAGQVAAAVARELDVREDPGRTLVAQLQAALAPRRLLLVLDNFEQVIEAGPVVAELLRGAPQVTVLATSREPLRVAGEHEHALEPLTEDEASALFLDRVRAVRSGYEPSPGDREEIAAICRRLDCLPLAVELAAARVKLLAPGEVRERLERRLDLLARAGHDVPARQRSLRAAIDWSYELLPGTEQTLFAQLSVFAGGAAVEDAESVCTVPGLNVLDGLASLQDKSLVHRDERAGTTRVRMLETVREYASELLAPDDADKTRRRHAAHFLALAERVEPLLWRGEQAQWLDRLGQEHDNLQRALDFWSASWTSDEGLRLAVALRRYWSVRGFFSEGLERLERALEGGTTAEGRLVVVAHRGCAMLAQHQGDYERALRHAEGELAAARALGDSREAAIALSDLAAALASQGEHERARLRHEESVGLLRGLDDPRNLASALVNLGDLELILGDAARAAASAEEGLALFREVGDLRGVAVALTNLGLAELSRGRTAAATAPLLEALETSVQLGDTDGVAYCLDALSAAASEESSWERSATLAGAAAALRDATGGTLEPAEDALRRRTIERLAAALAPETLEQALSAGAALAFEDAVAYALADA